MRDKPNYCYESNCPLATKGRGFSLGCGPFNSSISILFERPADDEIGYMFGGPKPANISNERWAELLRWQDEELERRRNFFPELTTPDQQRFLVRGAPVRGMSGAQLRQWVFPMVGGGISLEGVMLENVLHCAGKDNEYPTAGEKELAEAKCAHWNRLMNERPQVSIWSLHPAGLLKETGGGIVALPLQVDSFSKAKSFAKAGLKVVLLAGGRAAKWWAGYGESVTKWVGHFQREDQRTWERRLERIANGMQVILDPSGKKPRKPRVKKEKDLSLVKKPRRKKAAPIEGMESLGQ